MAFPAWLRSFFSVRSIVLLLMACLTAVVIAMARHHQVAINSNNHHVYLEKYAPSSESSRIVNVSAPRQINVGLEIENVYGLALHDRSFKAEGWYWLEYSDEIKEILDKFKIEPDQILRFANAIDDSDLTIGNGTAFQANVKKDGKNYFRSHFSGDFYIPDLELRSFPFYRLKLPIQLESAQLRIECNPINEQNCIKLAFQGNPKSSILGNFIDINGYITSGVTVSEKMLRSVADFGLEHFPVVSTIEATVQYFSAPSDGFWEYVFPVAVLLAIAIVSPSLQSSLGDIRIAIPPTVLLTLIFLQQSYSQELPPLAYATYLDWLYIYAYVVALVLFCLFCWGVNLLETSSSDNSKELVIKQINRVDLTVQLIAAAGFAALLLWGLTLSHSI